MIDKTEKSRTDTGVLSKPWIYILLGTVAFPFFTILVTPLWVVSLLRAIAHKDRLATAVSLVLLFFVFLYSLGI